MTPAQFGVFKSKARIERVLSELEKAEQIASRLKAPNYHELTKANEAPNYLLISKLAFRSALERKESRGFHSEKNIQSEMISTG